MAVFIGSRLSAFGLGQDDSGECRLEREGNNSLAPVALAGAGVRPYFPSLCSPRMRGMARRRGAWPGFRQTGPIARASPERRALALMTRAPAPLGAPPRHRSAFA